MSQIQQFLSNKLLRSTGAVFEIGKWFFATIVTVVLVQSLLLTARIVVGDSMLPNFLSGSYVLIDRRDWQGFARGDAVVLRYPGDPDNLQFIKRVVGLPGENVELKNGAVYISGKVISEPYLLEATVTLPEMSVRQLKKNEYFTLGDNRAASNDSRFFGPVERRFILGKVIKIIFTSKR